MQREGKVQTVCADSVGKERVANHTAGSAARSPLFLERFEMNPDIQLRHEVFAQLNWDPAVFGCDVDVRVTDGVVTLRGQLASEDLKNAVERAVRRAEGVKRIVNQLTTAECANND
ncbi:BON domain protein [Variovorax paradoxus]|uniref:BON domain protein n=1 Tax=Variovorax paradoxus TaxID=34073 RepID=A0A0H2LZR1_VARPD|nr:BON domain-containing protein [Variovorax paradoxus]KLN55316.1 BON domain protein [Variovorax paradoxus]